DKPSAKHRTDDEACAGTNHRARSGNVQYGPRAEERLARQRCRELLDPRDRVWHGHRHFERAHAALEQRVSDLAKLPAVGEADHGDHARFGDRVDDPVAGARPFHPRNLTAPMMARTTENTSVAPSNTLRPALARSSPIAGRFTK